MASHIPSDINELRTAFILMDSDRDGRVTAAEVQTMLERLGINFREDIVFNLVRSASQTGSTLMNEAEFLQWVKRIQALRPTPSTHSTSSSSSTSSSNDEEVRLDIIAAFRVFDQDKNGFITKDELRLAMDLIDESMNDNALNDLLKLVDVDKDGRINYEEFAKMLL